MHRGLPHKVLAITAVFLMLMQYVPVVQMMGGPRHHCPHCTGAYCPLKSNACKKEMGYCPHLPGVHHERDSAGHGHSMAHAGMHHHADDTPASTGIGCSCRNGAKTPHAVLVLDQAVVASDRTPVTGVIDRPYGRFPSPRHDEGFAPDHFRPPERNV